MELAEAETPPSVLAVPTGCGKTQAILGAWMYQRSLGNGPRRLVYALPMRSLVEQTRGVAEKMRDGAGLKAEELPIHILMGGEEAPEEDWRRHPERDQILIGTLDMLLSRALNRGYGESRFSWPISFGLLNSDCRWVFDEVQLMGPARTTSAQLDGLRAALGTVLPCETMWASATVDAASLRTVDRPQVGTTLGLPAADRDGPLRPRLEAEKTLEREDLSRVPGKDRCGQMAALARERHRRSSRTLVVVNNVETAQAIFASLEKQVDENSPRVVLLHSRFRPGDRKAHMEAALGDPGEAGTIVVSTQVIEAGVDVSACTLLTETAPFSSIVQRLGRCNRGGEEEDARVLWLDYGDPPEGAAGIKESLPYLPNDLRRARAELLGQVGYSLSPRALESIEVEETPDDPAILRRHDLIDLFDTSADLSGADIDIAPFIREDDQRSVLVCFREIGEDGEPEPDQVPDRTEVVQIPHGSIAKRRCWVFDYVDGGWSSRPGNRISPGATIVLDAAEGGYTPELGWDGKSKRRVDPIAVPDARSAPEAYGGENPGDRPEELLPHLEATRRHAEELSDELGLDGRRDAVVDAAALHDIGKAFPPFQEMIREVLRDANVDVDTADGGPIWAKSGVPGGRHRRRYLRHELVGALALRSLANEPDLSDRALITYLVAAHHGRVRLSIRPAPDEVQPEAKDGALFALGVIDGETLPSVHTPLGTLHEAELSLGCMALGAEDSWTREALALRDSPELGPLRLAYLEAIIRIADWRASSGA
jgi:CRISPR-associated endonuclease/helicase Cas3